MSRIVLSLLLAFVLIGLPRHALGECYDFESDPGIQSYQSPDGGNAFFIDLGETFGLPDGDCVSISFAIEEATASGIDAPSVLGPIPEGSELAEFGLNLHYDQLPVAVSLSTNEAGNGPRYEIELGRTYHAVFQRQGETVVLILYAEDGPAYDPVFSDTRTYSWPLFRTFQLSYDDPTGGLGSTVWNEERDRIDFLADRSGEGEGSLEGWIGYLCVEDGYWCTPTATEGRSWGSIRSLYR